MMPSRRPVLFYSATLVLAACGGSPRPERLAPASPGAPPTAAVAADATRAAREPFLPPAAAFRLGLMPLRSTMVDAFRLAHPTYDGRGVLIAILDSGIDPSAPGLQHTPQAQAKVLDLRDFSGEGRVALSPTRPNGDGTVTVAGRRIGGTGRITRWAIGDAWYAGTFAELPLGKPPAADVDGNGRNTDAFALVVARATDGWAVIVDAGGDGSFENDTPVRDFRVQRETLTLGTRPIALAVNFSDAGGVPVLDLFFDTSGHGTHVAGIAAGHDLYGVAGFDGVAPGAQLIGLKIANNARGGISTTGSMVRALSYALAFARQRSLPLVLNLSFGVGNEREGRATIDSIVDAFLTAHPDLVFSISAGNDGPGVSTMGFPGTAELALTAGALYPGTFAQPPQPGVRPAVDVIAPWSARGGESAKPDILTPGIAFSTVPPWDTGEEVKGGTSMASPYAAGLAALLVSAMRQESRSVTAAQVKQALQASALGIRRGSALDEGAGIPRIEVAYLWLRAGHQASRYRVSALPDGGNRSLASGAFRRSGLASPGDTLQRFRLRHVDGQRVALFALSSDAGWLSAPPTLSAAGGDADVTVTYDPVALSRPGIYVGTVSGRAVSDTLAGATFRLVNTVVVPFDLSKAPLREPPTRVAAGGVSRYFLTVPAGSGGLRARVTVTDSAQEASLQLFEPNGQPFRDTPSGASVGGDAARSFEFVVRTEDVVAGVYELTVAAPPIAGAAFRVEAELAPFSLGSSDGGSEVELMNPGASSRDARVAMDLIGGEWSEVRNGRGGPPESLQVTVPDWADHVIVDVSLPADLWDELTDFGVTVFDPAGQIVSEGPLNYAFGRQTFEVSEDADLAGRPITIELFPAFALERDVHPWQATVRVRFLRAEAQPVGSARTFPVVARGRVRVPLPGTLRVTAEGLSPLLEIRAADGSGETVRWVAAPK
jgi:tripeptidyl-peptidase II